MITREEFIRETVIGKRVVHKVSGYTGEVRLVFPEWGVEVWVPDRGNERERWSWAMITRRYPRSVKRFPRPFRFARLLPTLQCHCRIGRMEVKGEEKVQCLRCSFFIGSEAFPRRLERATKLLRKWLDYRSHNRDQEARERERRPINRPKNRPKKRSAHLGVQGRKKAQAPKKSSRNLVIRLRGGKEEKKRYGKTRSKAKGKGNPAVPKGDKVSPPARNGQRKKGQGKNKVARV